MHFVGFTSDNNPSSSLTRACLLPRYSIYAIIIFINYSYIYNKSSYPHILPNTHSYPSQWTYIPSDIVSYAIQPYKRLPGSPFRGEPVSVLTNAAAYPVILYPELFGSERWLARLLRWGNRLLHSPVTLRIRRYCVLGYSVLLEVISLLIHEGTGCCTHQWPCVSGDIVSWAIRSWGMWLAS